MLVSSAHMLTGHGQVVFVEQFGCLLSVCACQDFFEGAIFQQYCKVPLAPFHSSHHVK